jgi:hypothetical protein
MLITPDEILERYQKGERNFAGLRLRLIQTILMSYTVLTSVILS